MAEGKKNNQSLLAGVHFSRTTHAIALKILSGLEGAGEALPVSTLRARSHTGKGAAEEWFLKVVVVETLMQPVR